MPDAAPLLIFLHVPKTAGSTLKETLWRLYGYEHVLYLPHTPVPQAAAAGYHALPPAERANVRVVAGHFYNGIQDFLPRPSRLFTMLREPVDREISAFHQTRRMTGLFMHQEYLRKVSPTLTMRDYFASGYHHDLDNLQTRLLAGLDGASEPPPFGACDEAMLARAISNMDTHFDSVGLTEDYDRSVILLRRLYGWKLPFYVRANVTRERAHERIPDNVLEAIRANTRFDRRLYEYAAQKFAAQVEAQGASFEKDVRRFGQLNTLWQWKHRTWKLRQNIVRRLRGNR